MLFLSKSCFYLEDLGIYQSRGRAWAAQASAQNHCTTLPLPPLTASCALGILFVFVNHMHQWTFHHFHFTASQLRPVLPGSDGTLHTHFAGCTVGCTSQGELLCPFPPQPGQCRVQVNSQDWGVQKLCWCYMAMCPGHQERWGLRKWIPSVKVTSL